MTQSLPLSSTGRCVAGFTHIAQIFVCTCYATHFFPQSVSQWCPGTVPPGLHESIRTDNGGQGIADCRYY